ncbi:hypothetical protein [Bosea sp. 685]|uniref:hypothetical protein n=1 Tax=Bosea sp. 685 TaxID=3080057 RepID=UPI002892E0B4|nr:hypothetical protein [Bosea sp. 685]WNJ88473.1 hypothetical protein RMR04_18890 [Bosea sp. 685]
MSENDVKLFCQLTALEYMLQRLYVIMYAKEGFDLTSAKTFHKGLIEHINSQTFPTPDAAQSMLAAGELGDALSGFLCGLEQMMEDSGRFPKG